MLAQALRAPQQAQEPSLLSRALRQFERDPAFEYGSILPFRKPKGMIGAMQSGGSMDPQWGLGYSDIAKSIYDAFTSPGRAASGENVSPQEAMNFALTSGMGGMASGPLSAVPRSSVGMNVYHGSPYKFKTFDASKIGTGQGQAEVGHGFNFASAKEMAGAYTPSGGTLYKVDIPNKHIPQMLDMEKRLSEQSPKIQEALANSAFKDSVGFEGQLFDMNTKEALDLLARKFGKERVAQELSKSGIPGIRYIDREFGEANYLVFPEFAKDLKILKSY